MPAPLESSHVLVMILAGGEDRRLGPLTADRAKPAVLFGGRYHIIDIVLSNFVNSEHAYWREIGTILVRDRRGITVIPKRAKI